VPLYLRKTNLVLHWRGKSFISGGGGGDRKKKENAQRKCKIWKDALKDSMATRPLGDTFPKRRAGSGWGLCKKEGFWEQNTKTCHEKNITTLIGEKSERGGNWILTKGDAGIPWKKNERDGAKVVEI